jgi:hypothetical protein
MVAENVLHCTVRRITHTLIGKMRSESYQSYLVLAPFQGCCLTFSRHSLIVGVISKEHVHKTFSKNAL